MQCEKCGLNLEKLWNVCPKCGTFVKKPLIDNVERNSIHSKRKSKKPFIVVSAIILVIIVSLGSFFAYKYMLYQKAEDLLQSGNYSEAKNLYTKVGTEDALHKSEICDYYIRLAEADLLVTEGKYKDALQIYKQYYEPEIKEKANYCTTMISLEDADSLFEAGNYELAYILYSSIDDPVAKQRAIVCDRNIKLADADSLLDQGEYAAALKTYNQFDTPEINKKADICNYSLGVAAMKIEMWEAAKAHFEAMHDKTYLDTIQMIEKCEDGIKMAACADNDFLRDIETTILARLQLGSNAEAKDIAKEEYDRLKQYRNKKFYDNGLMNLAIAYIDGLKTQINSQSIKSHSDAQLEWIKGQVNRYVALNELNKRFGFLTNNNSFRGTYIDGLKELRSFQRNVQSVNSKLLTVFSQHYTWQTLDEYTSFFTLSNDTAYVISVKFYYELYSKNDDAYITTKTYTAENIPPKSDYNIYLDLYGIREESVSFYTDWEVISVR